MMRALCWLLAAAWAIGAWGQPLCLVTHYDEFSGLSQRHVKAVAQDARGMMWLATWNGLNRYDGYSFTTVKPHVGDGSGVYSDRVNDIRASATGLLWLRIDRRCVLFDPSTHLFTDVHRLLEKQSGGAAEVIHMRPARDSTTVMELGDGRFVTFDDRQQTIIATGREWPNRPYFPAQNKGLKTSEYENDAAVKADGTPVIYSGRGSDGTAWLVMQSGRIWRREQGQSAFVADEARIDISEKLYFATVDRQGNVWLRSAYGAYRLQFTRRPFHRLLPEGSAQVRCLFADRDGSIWVATKEDATVRRYDAQLSHPRYLTASGKLAESAASFGRAVYCMMRDKAGRLWLGTKPDGLFCLADGRLTQYAKGGAAVDGPNCNDVYDLVQDARGRIWMATNGGGVNCMDPQAGTGRWLHADHGLAGYPREAMSARRLCITRGGQLLVATTNGLLAADVSGIDATKIKFVRHAGEADRANSLGNVALMDVMEDRQGRIFVATESGGVNMARDNRLTQAGEAFAHFDASTGFPTDVALSLMEDGDALWVTGNNCMVRLRVPRTSMDGAAEVAPETAVYGASFFRQPLRFSEAHPLMLADGRCLMGLTDGGIVMSREALRHDAYRPPMALTAVQVEDRAPLLAVNCLDTLVMAPSERNISVNFAALDYAGAELIGYAYRIEGADSAWHTLGHRRSVSFLDMEPGTYRLQLCSTDSRGLWLDNVRTLTIIVKPRFVETVWFKLLMALLALLVVGAVVKTHLYIKAIRRKQRETLEMYLQLVKQSQQRAETAVPNAPPAAEVAKLGEADAAFMRRVAAFVEDHLSDADVNIQDMAAAAAVSRTGLNRKMKSLVGVTPAEFMRRSRIAQAQALLADTDRSITDIALSCGFADQNYFSKAFRAQTGMSPTAYRQAKK